MKHPTLFLGLGQVGTRALSQLRRHLKLDVDGRIAASFAAIGLGDLPPEDRELWDAGEYLPIEPHRVTNILLDLDRKVGDEPSWREALSWPQGLDPITLVDAFDSPGSRRSRLLGRLSLLTEQFAIERHLRRSLSRLRSQTGGCDRPVSIFLVASVSGGSGSGMLLDVAHLLRQFEPRSFRSLFLLLPNHAHEQSQVHWLRGVAYASLSELAAARHEDLRQLMRPWGQHFAGRERELFGRCFLFGAPEYSGSSHLLTRALVALNHDLLRGLVSRHTDPGDFVPAALSATRGSACFSQCGATWIDAVSIEPLGDLLISGLLVALQELCRDPGKGTDSSPAPGQGVSSEKTPSEREARPQDTWIEKARELARMLVDRVRQPIEAEAEVLKSLRSKFHWRKERFKPIHRVRSWFRPIVPGFSQGWRLELQNLRNDADFPSFTRELAGNLMPEPEHDRELRRRLLALRTEGDRAIDSGALSEYHRERLQKLMTPSWLTFGERTPGFRKHACEILSWWLAQPQTTEALATALCIAALESRLTGEAAHEPGASTPQQTSQPAPTEWTVEPEKPLLASALPGDGVAALKIYLEDNGAELRKWFKETPETDITKLIVELRTHVLRDRGLVEWLQANARLVIDLAGGWAERLHQELLCQAQETAFSQASARNPELVVFVLPRGVLWPGGSGELEKFLRDLAERPANASKVVVIERYDGQRLWCYRERLYHPLEALANYQSYERSFEENSDAILFPQLIGVTAEGGGTR